MREEFRTSGNKSLPPLRFVLDESNVVPVASETTTYLTEAASFTEYNETFEEQNRWTTGKLLGAGAHGDVFKAKGPENEIRAVKVFHRRNSRFVREEAEYQQRAARRGIAPELYELGTDYFVMELIQGLTLHEWSKQGPASSRLLEAAVGVLELSEALIAARAPHGDFTSHNIIVTNEGLVAIDFSVVTSGNMTTHHARGNVWYLYEQAMEQRGDTPEHSYDNFLTDYDNKKIKTILRQQLPRSA